jgi:glycosyltransferase involved in cell wall biosynthesis
MIFGSQVTDEIFSRRELLLRGGAGFGALALSGTLMALSGIKIRLWRPWALWTRSVAGTLSMLLGEGKPSIVSDVGSFTEYPDTCCPKVPVGQNEEDVLAANMLGFMESSSLYTQAKLAAHAFSRERSWSRCAEQYLDFIDAVLARRPSGRGASGEY